MSYKTLETSLASRVPIRLYLFKRGALRWAYNSSSQVIKRGNIIYQSLRGGVSDQGIITSDGGISDNFKIIAPADIEVAQLFYGMPPSARIELEVLNTHLQTEEVKPVWWGTVVNVSDAGIDKVEIVASPQEVLSNRPGVTLVYSRQCGAVIYDAQCKVNKELYRVRTTLQQINSQGVEATVASQFEENWFTGGFIEYISDGGEQERRYIEWHNGSTLILWGGSQGMSPHQEVSLFPGCNTAPHTCAYKFNNQLNRQSFDHLQGRSPFDGNQIF